MDKCINYKIYWNKKLLQVPQIELIDVIPLSLGIDTEDGRFIEMIPRNTKVPFKMSQKFYTSENDQRGMTFAVYSISKIFLFDFSFINALKFRFSKAKVQSLTTIVILDKS